MMPSKRPSRVTIHLKSGASYTETVEVSRGDIEKPYTDQEIEKNFLSLTSPVYGLEGAKGILDRTRRIDTFNEIRHWTEGL